MLPIFYDPHHVRHDPAGLHTYDPRNAAYYVEVARRGELIYHALQAAGLGPIQPPQDWGMAPLAAVHTPALLELLATAYQQLAREAGAPRPVIPETYQVNPAGVRRPRTIFGRLGQHCFDIASPIFAHTWDVAYWSAQVALSAAAAVQAGQPWAYALCRPPGHHATADMYGGFCYLNNAAIAAQWLAGQGRRVAILDVDYHHGNGTQAIFYTRPGIFFCSIHADPLDEYPYYWGYADERGAGPGLGTTLNLPLPLGCDEAGYWPALQTACAAIAAFAADVLVISLGVDTFVGDPAGGFRLHTGSYGRMAREIAALRLPALIIQEGGYRLDALGENVAAFLSALCGG